MDTQIKTKTCANCGKQKPQSAFIGAQGKTGLICSNCLATLNTDDDSGGSGFQLDIVNKTTTADIEQAQATQEAAEQFDAAEERIEQQNEDLDNQGEKAQKYRNSLFGDNKHAETPPNTKQNTDTIAAEITATADSADTKQRTSDEAKEKSTSKNAAQSYKSNLFSNNDKTHTSSTQAQQSTQQNTQTAERSPSTEKTNQNIQTSLFGTNIANEATLRDAAGEPNANGKEGFNDLAARFIKDLARGPGR